MESPKDTDEKHAMHSKGHKIEIIIYDKVNEVIKKILNQFFIDIKLG